MAQFDRTITHWTGGGPKANSVDKKSYNTITEQDGTVVQGKHSPEDNIVTSDGIYAAHTFRLNTRSIGKAMAGMLDAKESPLDFGPYPITEKQFEAHCKELARTHTFREIPVSRATCLTHAEVEITLGVKQKQKWDITVLQFKPKLKGAIAVGDYMRSRVNHYMKDFEPKSETPKPEPRFFFTALFEALFGKDGR